MFRKDVGLPIVTYTNNGVELNPELSNKVLNKFLKRQRSKKVKVWDKGSVHTGFLTNKAGERREITITFPRKMVYRSRQIVTTKKKYARYDIVGDQIGFGMYGNVYDVLATLSHLRNGLMRISTNHEYVIKAQDHTQENDDGSLKNDPSIAINEERINHLLPYLGSKRATYIKNENGKIVESYLVLFKLKKQTLLDVIVNDYNDTAYISTRERFKLSIALLRDYVDQYYDRGIVHRDVKAPNIMVEETGECVKYFDSGLSRIFTELDDSYVGTPIYSAPEVFNQNTIQDCRADFYSLGIILFHLWHGGEIEMSLDVLKQYAQAKQSRKFTDIGQGISGVDDLLAMIEAAINGLIIFEPNERSHPLKVLDKFESLYLEYKLKSENEFIMVIREANLIARDANYKLRDVKLRMIENPLVALQKIIDNAVENLKLIKASQVANQADVEKIVVMEFVDIINVRAFKEIAKSGKFVADDIQIKAQQIITSFINNANLAVQMLDQLKFYSQLLGLSHRDIKMGKINLVVEDLYESIDVISYKIKMCEITFDDLEVLNQKCNRKFPDLKKIITQFEKQISEQEKYKLLNTYNQLFIKLKPMPGSTPSIQFRNEIRKVMKEYIENKLIPQEVKGHEKSSNEKYRNDIEEMLAMLNVASSDLVLQEGIIKKLDAMGSSLFSNNKLQKNLRDVVANERRRLAI